MADLIIGKACTHGCRKSLRPNASRNIEMSHLMEFSYVVLGTEHEAWAIQARTWLLSSFPALWLYWDTVSPYNFLVALHLLCTLNFSDLQPFYLCLLCVEVTGMHHLSSMPLASTWSLQWFLACHVLENVTTFKAGPGHLMLLQCLASSSWSWSALSRYPCKQRGIFELGIWLSRLKSLPCKLEDLSSIPSTLW